MPVQRIFSQLRSFQQSIFQHSASRTKHANVVWLQLNAFLMFCFDSRVIFLPAQRGKIIPRGKLINFISTDRFNWVEKSIVFFVGMKARRAREKKLTAQLAKKNQRSWKMIFYCFISNVNEKQQQIEYRRALNRQKIIYWIIASPNPWNGSKL